jgi:nitrogen regulatory protein PII
MALVTQKLVTIVAERLLKERLLREIKELGAKGFTITEATGEGSRGVRASEWEGRNIKIETVVSPTVAVKIIDHIAQHYFQYHAVIVYAQTIEVVRGEKYT